MVNLTGEFVGEDPMLHDRWNISDWCDEVKFCYIVAVHFLLLTFDEVDDFKVVEALSNTKTFPYKFIF